LPLTQTLSNIYGRRSVSPDVPGSNLDETQVRKRANFAKIADFLNTFAPTTRTVIANLFYQIREKAS